MKRSWDMSSTNLSIIFVQLYLDIKFQANMECQYNQYHIPRCPSLRPSNSSQDFDDITLQQDFSISNNSQTEPYTPSLHISQNDFIEEDEQPVQAGKRSFNQVSSSTKPSFSHFIERPEKRPQKKIHR